MGMSRKGPSLSVSIEERLRDYAGEDGMKRAKAWIAARRSTDAGGSAPLFQGFRLSFSDMLLHKVVRERWQICLLSQECDEEGAAKFVYGVSAGKQAFTYIARAYPWDGVEKVGRRSDGANRDMFGALFVGHVSKRGSGESSDTFDIKSEGQMRTDFDVIGWTPANRSSRHFERSSMRWPEASKPAVTLLAT